MRSAYTYTVIYRTGGHARFEWKRTQAFDNYNQAALVRRETERAGYLAYLFRSDVLAAELKEGAFQRYDPSLADGTELEFPGE